MKSFCTAIAAIGLIFAVGGSATAGFPAQNTGAQGEQDGLRCRRLQRAVQMVVASEGYESPRLRRPTATVRKPRRVIRDVLGYSVQRRSVGRTCFQCISRQIRRRTPLAEQEACGFHDTCLDEGTCPPCSHDVCDAGAALSPTCNTCAADVCEIDPFCCDTLWSEDCVAKVETICGDPCGAPPPSTSTTSTTLEDVTSTTLLDTTTTTETSSTTSSLAAATTTTVPETSEEPSDCENDAIDFEELHAGKIVAQVLTAQGRPVVVKGTNSRFDAATNAAVIYDSACVGGCSGQDPDLGTPNEDFDGPGVGEGGERGKSGENASLRGNVLIIGENLSDIDGDGFVDDPDDQGTATVIHELDFSAFAPTTVLGLTLLDIENVEQPASIELFDMNGASLAKFPVPATGNNGVAEVELTPTSGVWKMIVTLRGSSAIDEIRLGCTGGGGSTTTTTTSTTTTTLGGSGSRACDVTFSVDNATTTLALQFEANHSGTPGGFSKGACTVVPTGLVDINADGDTVEIGWADSTGSGFTGPGTFATCTFVSTGGVPAAGDFPIEILDCSGMTPPNPCSPTPLVGVTVGDCEAVTAACGNEVVEAGETCDDGNILAGDGCSSLCQLEGTTTTTTVPVTTTTLDDTPTTTLPDTTTTTVEAVTTTSTTSTTLAEDYEFVCTLRTAVTSSETLGSLKYEIDFSGVSGDFAGSGLAVECTSLVAGASKSFFEDAVNRKLRESVISLNGFQAPLDLATCNFQTNDNSLVAADFPLIVKDATTPDLVLVTPTVIVKSVECAAAALGFASDFTPRIPDAAPNGTVF